jgi:cytochrome c
MRLRFLSGFALSLAVVLFAQFPVANAEPRNLAGHGGPVKALAVSPDGAMLLSGSFDYSARGWSIADSADKPLFRFDNVDGAINAVAFAGDRFVVAGDAGILHILDAVTRKRLARLDGHTAKINALAVSPDTKHVVSSSWDRTARIWSLARPEAAAVVLKGHRAPVNAAVFSADGKTVFTASADGQLRAFDTVTGELRRAIYKHGWGLNVLSLTPDGAWIAYGAVDGGTGLIAADGSGREKRLAAHDKPVLGIAIGGGRLATAGADGLIRVWDTASWAPVEEFKNPYGPIWSLALTPDGKTAFYGGLDDVIHVWQVTPRKPFEPVASSYPRRFQLQTDSDDPVERGRIQFARKCSVCHTLTPDGANRAGPTLHKIFGRRIATAEGYRFSEPLKQLDIVWTPETLSKLFEIGPDKFTPGSKMPLQIMSDPGDRADLVAFLKSATDGQSRP